MIAVLYRLFGPMQGTTITVTRPTTSDGEQVSLTTTARVGAPAQEIAEKIETLSLAAQARMQRQNEIVLQAQVATAHGKWTKIKRKMDAGAKLSGDENRWWSEFGHLFDEAGPLLDTKQGTVVEAAESPKR